MHARLHCGSYDSASTVPLPGPGGWYSPMAPKGRTGAKYPRRHGPTAWQCFRPSALLWAHPPPHVQCAGSTPEYSLCLLRYPVAPIDPDRTEMAEAFRPISVAAYRRSLQTTEEGKANCLPAAQTPTPTSHRARAVLRRSAPPLPLCCAVAVWCLRARAVNSPRRTAERFAPVRWMDGCIRRGLGFRV